MGYQQVLPPDAARIDLGVDDVAESDVLTVVTEFAGAGFDVTLAPPVRARLLKVSATESVLVFVVHHIAADGFSMAPLTRDVMIAYAARTHAEVPTWSPLAVQYADYTLWQREILGDEADPQSVASAQLDYWKSTLAGLPEEVVARAEELLRNLEAQGHDPLGRPRWTAGELAPPPGSSQLQLFARPEDVVAGVLRELDLERLTPLAALNLLQTLQARLR